MSAFQFLLSHGPTRCDFIPNSPHGPRWLLQLHPSHHHPHQQEGKKKGRQADPPPCGDTFLKGKRCFYLHPLAETLSHGSLVEGRCHLLPGQPGAPLGGQVLLQRRTGAQKAGHRQEPGPHQPILLPLMGRRPFPEENLSFSNPAALGVGLQVGAQPSRESGVSPPQPTVPGRRGPAFPPEPVENLSHASPLPVPATSRASGHVLFCRWTMP